MQELSHQYSLHTYNDACVSQVHLGTILPSCTPILKMALSPITAFKGPTTAQDAAVIQDSAVIQSEH